MPVPAILWIALGIGGISLLNRKEGEGPVSLEGNRSELTPGVEQQLELTSQRRRPEDRGPGNKGSAYQTNQLPKIRGFEIRGRPIRQRPDYQREPVVRFTEGIPARKSLLHPTVERNLLTIRRHSKPLLITDTGVSTDRSLTEADIMPDDRNREIQRME